MGSLSYQLLWGPGLVGLIVGLLLYGVGIGQFIFYVRAFPQDKLQLKMLVFLVFIFDSVQTFASVWFYYYLLIECRLNTSPRCAIDVPPPFFFTAAPLYCVTFMVQSFYAHRVWIISGRNRILTSIVLVSTLAQLAFGWVVIADTIRTPTFQYVFQIKFSPLTAVASAVCDATITTSIMYYLRPARTGIKRRGDYIKKLNAVFVQMGLFSFINALSMVVMFYIQDNGVSQLLTAAPGIILSKTYMNSMLGVLNARKAIREEKQAEAQRPVEVPTLPTIQ